MPGIGGVTGPLPQIQELILTGDINSIWWNAPRRHWLHFFPSTRHLTLSISYNLWLYGEITEQLETYEATHRTHLTLCGSVPSFALQNLAFPAL